MNKLYKRFEEWFFEHMDIIAIGAVIILYSIALLGVGFSITFIFSFLFPQ